MRLNAEILCIGTELTTGYTLNTNAQFISEALSNIGIVVSCHIGIPDKKPLIISTIKESLSRTRLLIITGGLGPTIDDLTLESVAEALNRKLILSKIKGSKILINPAGIAPGLIIPYKGKFIIALPGVPAELKSIFLKSVVPFLKRKFPGRERILTKTLKTTGLPESEINKRIKKILVRGRTTNKLALGIYPHPDEVNLRITVRTKDKGSAKNLIKKIEKKIRQLLGDYVFGEEDETMESVIARLLSRSKKTVAIAESCTGGLISDRITDIPGSSNYFKMSVIAYSNESKYRLLDISKETIKKYGAVSKQIAMLMAKNVRLLAGTNFGIGITGICGPQGATAKKPVGLVYTAVSTKDKTQCRNFRFSGDRKIVKLKASQSALDMLRKQIIRRLKPAATTTSAATISW